MSMDDTSKLFTPLSTPWTLVSTPFRPIPDAVIPAPQSLFLRSLPSLEKVLEWGAGGGGGGESERRVND